MYSFESIDSDKINIKEYYDFQNKSLFTTLEWLEYIKTNQKAKSVIIRITKGSDFIGYFTGLIIVKFGVKIIGSPFNGWSTGYMGFDIVNANEKINLVEPLSKFLFENYKCWYIQISDRVINETQLQQTKLKYIMDTSLELNLDMPLQQLFKKFKSECRTLIRQFEKRGASIHIALPDEQFAIEYYEQLQEVFAKQNLVPTYGVTKVVDLFNSLNKAQLLCLRVENPEGKSIATSIFVGYNQTFYFWGAASFRQFQFYRPNEYMIWYAIKYFSEKEYKYFDMCGERDYKRKFNPEKISYPCIMIAKFRVLIKLREVAKKIVWLRLKIKGVGKKKAIGKQPYNNCFGGENGD